jgi:hypothetical protein|tara:strand:- start:490 stop:642 length:153 start_codon:yes stop_codon:yes gene_type:complete
MATRRFDRNTARAVADKIARDRSVNSCRTSANQTPDAAELAAALTAIYEA